MQVAIIKSPDNEIQDFGNILAKQLFSADDISFSLTEVTLQGEQETSYNTGSVLAYYVLEGEGAFYINKEKYTVTKGDLVIIPKNTPYKDEGNLTLLAFSSPAFNRDNQKKV